MNISQKAKKLGFTFLENQTEDFGITRRVLLEGTKGRYYFDSVKKAWAWLESYQDFLSLPASKEAYKTLLKASESFSGAIECLKAGETPPRHWLNRAQEILIELKELEGSYKEHLDRVQ